jgi:hypothetical protein
VAQMSGCYCGAAATRPRSISTFCAIHVNFASVRFDNVGDDRTWASTAAPRLSCRAPRFWRQAWSSIGTRFVSVGKMPNYAALEEHRVTKDLVTVAV